MRNKPLLAGVVYAVSWWHVSESTSVSLTGPPARGSYLMTSDDLQPNLRASLWPCYFDFIARLFQITLAKPVSNQPWQTSSTIAFNRTSNCLRMSAMLNMKWFICFMTFSLNGRQGIFLLIFPLNAKVSDLKTGPANTHEPVYFSRLLPSFNVMDIFQTSLLKRFFQSETLKWQFC